MNQETLEWKLFPFSLKGRAKQWYSLASRDKFCLAFFPLPKVVSLQVEVLTFKQQDKESLGAG
jgi:hypothetical protein